MKVSKEEVSAVAAADKQAKKAVAKAKKPGMSAAERTRRDEQARDVWHQVTKVVVPMWFGNCSVMDGLKLSQKFGPAGALALTFVGREWRKDKGEGTHPFSMELTLRHHGFDRQEARELMDIGFIELAGAKLLKVVKKAKGEESATYTLSAKGQKWFELLERSTGCATGDDE